jgi:hypothetical protein
MESLVDEPVCHAWVVGEHVADPNVTRGKLPLLFAQKDASGNAGFPPTSIKPFLAYWSHAIFILAGLGLVKTWMFSRCMLTTEG